MTHALTQPAPQERAWVLPATARRVLLLAPPLAFAAFEGLHPRPEVNAQAVMDVATWFAAFHAIQLVLMGLVAVTVAILADELGAARAWSTRLGIGTFLIFFSAYDAVAGIATGLAMRSARDLPAAQQEAVFETVKDWPGFDPAVFALNIVGTLGWVVALVGIALIARRGGAPRTEWIFIGLAGLFLLGGHPFPFGTVAFGCLFIAALLHERTALRARRSEPGRNEI
jgi:uncharacterized membrane protein